MQRAQVEYVAQQGLRKDVFLPVSGLFSALYTKQLDKNLHVYGVLDHVHLHILDWQSLF